jgi:hypothetical protein
MVPAAFWPTVTSPSPRLLASAINRVYLSATMTVVGAARDLPGAVDDLGDQAVGLARVVGHGRPRRGDPVGGG